jgi:predicted Zn finger-like uncharacterized protein
MLIVCPSCASEYTIDPEKLGADGRTVRCALCRDTWFVSPETAASPDGDQAEGPTDVPEQVEKPVPPERAGKSRVRRTSLAAAFGAVAIVLGGVAWWWGAAHDTAHLKDGLGWAKRVLARAASGREGLGFENVTAALSGTGEDASLLVAGEIVNRSQREINLSHLAILVRNEDEKVLATWTDAPPGSALGPGRTLRFATRLPSPPPDGRQVRVQFTSAGGIAVAVHEPAH